MTYDWWWAKMGVLALGVVGVCVWLYREVKRADLKAEEDAAIERDALVDEIRAEMREKSPVYGLPKSSEKGFMARARRAESLGFRDDELKDDTPRKPGAA